MKLCCTALCQPQLALASSVRRKVVLAIVYHYLGPIWSSFLRCQLCKSQKRWKIYQPLACVHNIIPYWVESCYRSSVVLTHRFVVLTAISDLLSIQQILWGCQWRWENLNTNWLSWQRVMRCCLKSSIFSNVMKVIEAMDVALCESSTENNFEVLADFITHDALQAKERQKFLFPVYFRLP